ncbi:MAG: hypothetical protein LBK95_19410 [Bifidobacteriaceae bacterium]|nr:hypothetical protein [Bifidobacteriaceae bacterium]
MSASGRVSSADGSGAVNADRDHSIPWREATSVPQGVYQVGRGGSLTLARINALRRSDQRL